jgi:hypothetical protein
VTGRSAGGVTGRSAGGVTGRSAGGAGYCASSYLAFRWVVGRGVSWRVGVTPEWPAKRGTEPIEVGEVDEIQRALRGLVDETLAGAEGEVGLLLSGGVDSAVLGALLPRGTKSYTIRFDAAGAVDESLQAAVFAEQSGLDHRVVTVGWADHLDHADDLMVHKRSPLHPGEVGLHAAARQAAADGVGTLVVGNGAESTFGGLDELLSRDWDFDAFVKRYTFMDPAAVLADPVDVTSVYERYRSGRGVNVQGFLETVHGQGVAQALHSSIGAAGVAVARPFEQLALPGRLDVALIRNGQGEHLLRGVFRRLYPGLEAPEKIESAPPMDQWLAGWEGPSRAEFRAGLELEALTGGQRWLVYCLERFLTLLDRTERWPDSGLGELSEDESERKSA